MVEFIKKYKISIVSAILFSFICFGFMLTHFALSIDEETWIMGGPLVGWLRQSRYALWLYDVLFTDNGNYVPFLYDFLGIILWNISGVIICECWNSKGEYHPFLLFLMLAYFDSVPFVLADIMSFSMYLIQIGIAAIATAISVKLTVQYYKPKKIQSMLLAVILLWWSFGTYQAFICFYISAFAGYCVIHYISENREYLWKIIGVGVCICIAGVIGYVCIDKVVNILAGSDGYLQSNYIGWMDENPVLNFLMFLANVGRVSFAVTYKNVSVNGAMCIRVLTSVFIVYAFIRVMKYETKKKDKIIVFVLCVALSFSPFFLYIAMATYKTVGRMMLGLPIVGMAQIYLISKILSKQLVKNVFAIALSVLLFRNACEINRSYYDQSVSFGKDCDIVSQLMYDIQSEGIDYHNKSLVFIGMVPRDYIPNNQIGELGSSFFSHDDGNSARMSTFIRTRGYAVQDASAEQLNQAYQLASDNQLSCWPQKNSIFESDGLIVVKLSDTTDKWFMVNGVVQ